MSYVRRPSNRSYSPEMMPSNGPISPVKKGCVHPPRRKSLVGTSTGPPGACMTPSSDRKTAPVSVRISAHTFDRSVECGDVGLVHRHHRLEGTLAPFARRAGQLQQPLRGDLPGIAPLVLAPATHALFAATFGNGVPIAVGLFLIVGQDHEAHGLVRLEVRAAVEPDEGLAKHSELNRQLFAPVAPGKIGGGVMRRTDAAVREDGGVEFSGLPSLAFVEPQASR